MSNERTASINFMRTVCERNNKQWLRFDIVWTSQICWSFEILFNRCAHLLQCISHNISNVKKVQVQLTWIYIYFKYFIYVCYSLKGYSKGKIPGTPLSILNKLTRTVSYFVWKDFSKICCTSFVKLNCYSNQLFLHFANHWKFLVTTKKVFQV
jgi:hypothetical protein